MFGLNQMMTMKHALFFPLSILITTACALSAAASPAQSGECLKAGTVAERTSTLWGLPFRHHVACTEVPDDEFNDYWKKMAGKENSETGEESIRLYRLIGLIPHDFDYSQCRGRDAPESIKGIYDYSSRGIIIRKNASVPEQVLAHELVHALQDQYFDLKSLHRTMCGRTDSCLALGALTEGDAVLTDEKYTRQYAPPEDTSSPVEEKPSLDAGCVIPEKIISQFEFPYTFGRIFMSRVRKSGRNNAWQKTFHHPPQTTREILHEKDFQLHDGIRFKPVHVTMPSKHPDLGRKISEDTIGQYTIRLLFGSPDPRRDKNAILAAKGWRGDTAALYSSGRNYSLIWESVWETEKDARDFFDTIKSLLADRLGVSLEPAAAFLRAGISTGTDVELRLQKFRVQIVIEEK